MPESQKLKCTCPECERPATTTIKQDGDKITFRSRVDGKKHTFELDKKAMSGE